MSDQETRELARQAGDGDVESARKLSWLLERRAEEAAAPADLPDIRDKLDRRILPGCFIVYSVGREGLSVGKVIRLSRKEHPRVPNRWEERVTVIGIDDRWDKKPSLKKKGTLGSGSTVIVIAAHQIPEKYMKLFDDEKEPSGGQGSR